MRRLLVLIALMAGLSACTSLNDLEEKPQPMGRFLLGHNIVVVDNPEVGPFSREATDEEWRTILTAAMDERFKRYDGDKYYHIGVKLAGYMLAPVGVPGVMTPDSTLVLTVTVWEDETQQKMNAEPEVLTVIEPQSPKTFISSGLVNTREEQMLLMSRAAAKAVHDWMLEHPEWFGDASLMDPATTSEGWPAEMLDLETVFDGMAEDTQTAPETGEDGVIVIESQAGA